MGFYLDEFLDMQSHISKLCQLIHYSFRNIGHVRNLIDDETCKMLVHSWITSRMDYCNSLLYGLPKKSIARLQLIQNKTARIVTRLKKKSNHITPVLQSLHWLPVEKRIAFKIGCHCFKCIHGTASDHLTSLVSIYNPNRTLSSSSAVSLDQSIPKSNFSRRAFSFLSRLCGMPCQQTPDALTHCPLLKVVKTLIFSITLSFNNFFYYFCINLFTNVLSISLFYVLYIAF